MSAARAKDWFKQAENDLLWANDTLAAGRYAQACFIAQQIGEKSFKALAYHKGDDLVKFNSIMEIGSSLNLPDGIINLGKKLDLYYISARYPDAFPSGAPFEYFTLEQAADTVVSAEKILLHVKGYFNEYKYPCKDRT